MLCRHLSPWQNGLSHRIQDSSTLYPASSPSGRPGCPYDLILPHSRTPYFPDRDCCNCLLDTIYSAYIPQTSTIYRIIAAFRNRLFFYCQKKSPGILTKVQDHSQGCWTRNLPIFAERFFHSQASQKKSRCL